MATRVKINHAGMAALLKDPKIRALLTTMAQPVLAAAKADPHDDTGAYEASLHIEQDTTDRVAVRIAASDPKSHILEARYGILARALGAAR